MPEARGEASSADGAVTVTASPEGAVLDLRLTPLAMQRSHTELQEEILRAIQQAAEQATTQPTATKPTRRSPLPPPRPSATQRRRPRP